MAVLNIKPKDLVNHTNGNISSSSNGNATTNTNQQATANNAAAQQTASQQAQNQPAASQQAAQTANQTANSSVTLPGANKSSGYQSKYGAQLDSIIQQIQNTPDFKYEFNQDPLFGYYADMYKRNGQQAMMDTIGQASAMTGGYGNSYAASVGNQAYQNWLRQIYDKGLEFRNAARENYDTDLNNLYNRYNLLQNADNQAYQQWLQQAQYDLEREKWEWQKAQAEAAAGGGGGGGGGRRKKTTESPAVSDPIIQGASILTSVLNGVNNNAANSTTGQQKFEWKDTHGRVNEQRKREKYYAK